MEISVEDACKALIDGKIVIAYFGNQGDYKYNHLAIPVEIRLFGNAFCTYISQGEDVRPLPKGEIKSMVLEKFKELDIYPILILNRRPVNEPLR